LDLLVTDSSQSSCQIKKQEEIDTQREAVSSYQLEVINVQDTSVSIQVSLPFSRTTMSGFLNPAVFRRGRTVFQQLRRPGGQAQRAHHPDPFNPKVTKGWAAAMKASHVGEGIQSQAGAMVCVIRLLLHTHPFSPHVVVVVVFFFF
jgi:hypothetical protein